MHQHTSVGESRQVASAADHGSLVKNQASSLPVQAKLTVGAPDNMYEQEADAVAERVMRMPEPDALTPFTSSPIGVQRKCAHCMEEEKQRLQTKPITPFIQRKGEGGQTASEALTSRINATRGAGSSLSDNTRSFMESRIGADFSGVRVHTGSEAVQMNRELNAQAFTVGRDVYFGEGKYSPESSAGKSLLAHELTHVVQQGGMGSNQIQAQRDGEVRNIFVHNGIPSFLDCDLADVQSDYGTSCCQSDTLSQLPGFYTEARRHTDRAIQRMNDGANMDDAITQHFGSGALWYRNTILQNLRTIRRELDRESNHHARCRIGIGGSNEEAIDLYSQLDRSLFCQFNVIASASREGNFLTLCIDMDGNILDGWRVILHEVAHFSGVAHLPNLDTATPAEMQRGEFESYEHGEGYPNPMPFALRNADSYASFVRDIGAPTWSEESHTGAWAPNLEVGGVLSLEGLNRPGVVGRMMWTPLGRNFQMTVGLGGIWLPQARDSARTTTDLQAYAGPELGLRWISGTSGAQFVLDVAGGAGPYIRVDDSVDPAISARLGLGVRLGGPRLGFGISAEVMDIFRISEGDLAGGAANDLFGGLVFRSHWGGSSARPR